MLQAVLTAAVEAGHTTALIPSRDTSLAATWQQVVRFNPVYLQPDGELLDAQGGKVQPDGGLLNAQGGKV